MTQYKIYATDKNDNLKFIREINDRKHQIINHMVTNKKTMMIHHGFFINLVEIEDADINSDKS